jgi:hypothetical protein
VGEEGEGLVTKKRITVDTRTLQRWPSSRWISIRSARLPSRRRTSWTFAIVPGLGSPVAWMPATANTIR